MMKFERSGKIDASIDTVFECITDINFLKSEIARFRKDERPKLHYDKKAPFSKGKKIILNIDSSQLIFKIEEYVKPEMLTITAFHGKYKKIFGSFFCEISLKSVDGKTFYKSIYTSEKSPKGILRFLIRIYLLFSWFYGFRRFKEYVQLQKNV